MNSMYNTDADLLVLADWLEDNWQLQQADELREEVVEPDNTMNHAFYISRKRPVGMDYEPIRWRPGIVKQVGCSQLHGMRHGVGDRCQHS